MIPQSSVFGRQTVRPQGTRISVDPVTVHLCGIHRLELDDVIFPI